MTHLARFFLCHLPLTFNIYIHYSGKCFVALRAYVPNEQAWVCDFLARVAKPKLLVIAMTRIQLGITDQCSQEQVASLCILDIFSNFSCICRGSRTRWPGKAQRQLVFTTPITFCAHGTKFIWVSTHYAWARSPTKTRAGLQ